MRGPAALGVFISIAATVLLWRDAVATETRTSAPNPCAQQKLEVVVYAWPAESPLFAELKTRVREAQDIWAKQQVGCRPKAFSFRVEPYNPNAFCFWFFEVFCGRPPDSAFKIHLEEPPYTSMTNIPAREGNWNPSNAAEIAHELGHVLQLGDDYYTSNQQPKPCHERHLMATLDGLVVEHETHSACTNCSTGCLTNEPECPKY
jgi:hypothetical protein